MKSDKKKVERLIVSGLLLWGLGVAAAAYSGLLQAIPREFGAAMAIIGIIIPTALYFLNPGLRGYIDGLGLKTLTTFHVWRIGAGLVFLLYGALGLLPGIFVANAGYGDIAVGLLAAVLLLLPEYRLKYWFFHIVGMADFVIAVSTGLTLVLTGDRLMNNLFTMPVVLIPLFGVGVSGAAHIYAFANLWKPDPREITEAAAV